MLISELIQLLNSESFGKIRLSFLTLYYLEKALLIKNENWYQLFYNNNKKDGLNAAKKLLELLPNDEKEIKLASLPKELWVFVHQKWNNLHFNNHFIYKFPKQIFHSSKNIAPLLLSDLDYILQHQKYTEEYGGVNYLEHRIKNGITLGYRINENLVGWIILHDDYSIGFLRVLPKYRNQGIATQLTSSMINIIINHNLNAISYISSYNKASRKIATKLRAEIIGEVSWVRLRSSKEISNYEKGVF